MTAAALAPAVNYNGNGVTLAFAAPFRFLAGTLRVDLIAASGTVTRLTLGVHYSVTGGDTDTGGTVTMVTPPALGAQLRIRRATPRAQSTDYDTNDRFPAETHEAALDRQMLIAQEQDVEIADLNARTYLVPDGELGATLLPAANRAAKLFGFDENGDPAFYVPLTGPAGSINDYTGQLTSTGLNGLRLRHKLATQFDGNGVDNTSDFTQGRASAHFAAGAGGAPYDFYDQTALIGGLNVDAGGNRLNAALGSLGLFMEGNYWQDSIWAFECQFRYKGTDNVEIRPLQWFLPRDGATVRDKSDMSLRIDKVRLHDWADNEIAVWDLHARELGMNAGVFFRFEGNNAPVAVQKNAAGAAYVNLPYIDVDDNERHSAPIVGVMEPQESPSLFASGQKYLLALRGIGFTPNDYLDYIDTGDVVAGELFVSRKATGTDTLTFELQAKAAGTARMNLIGTNAASGIYVNGTKVLGAQQAALPAVATDLATALTLVNALRATNLAMGFNA